LPRALKKVTGWSGYYAQLFSNWATTPEFKPQPYPAYNRFLPAALAFAHRALAAAEILALAAALSLLLALGASLTATFVPFTFAHLALAAAEILALAAALIVRFFFGTTAATGFAEFPKIRFNSFSSD
jgi:hypothetical protein